MNKVYLIGRVSKDVETRYSGETAVSRYSLAIDRRYHKEGEQTADFVPCVAFGKQGEFAEKYLKKGMKIAVCGRIQTGSYTNRDGQKVYTTDIVVEEHEFCEKREGDVPKVETRKRPDPDDFVPVPDNIQSELPFN